MYPDFSRRSERSEWMDDPSIDSSELEETLDHLARVNRVLGGHRPTVKGVDKLAGDRGQLSVLDVGTGSGDVPRKLARWARRRGMKLRVTGIDRSPIIVDHAKRRCEGFDNIEIEQVDLFDIPDRNSYDIVHASLLLHHLPGESAVDGLKKMYEVSRLGVVINDLHRHPLGYVGSKIILALLSKNRLIRHDGPLSVLRAFERDELYSLAQKAGLPRPTIRWRPFFRWQMVIQKEQR